MATLFKSLLNNSLNIYVEYSNEVWNGIFSQHTYNANQATSLLAGPLGPILDFDNTSSTMPWLTQWRNTALRAMQISNLFRSVFGDCEMNSRVRVVLAGQVECPILSPVHVFIRLLFLIQLFKVLI